MTTARLRRALSGVRSTTLTGPATGGFDRTHDGLISGWFTCTTCGTPPTATPDLLLNGQGIATVKCATPRGDVPGGIGFLLRFTPTDTSNSDIRVHCPTHPDQGLDLHVTADTWVTPALAAIEHSSWSIITGWLALLAAPDGAVKLVVDGYDPIPVRATIRRPDVQAYLGTSRVGGFHLDLGSLLGYALPDATPIRLVLDGQVLANATITDSPLGESSPGCLTDPTPTGDEALDDNAIYALRRRFRDTGVDTTGDWRNILDRLCQREYSAETEQWADYLIHHGQTQEQVSAWLSLRATRALGVPALNTLPGHLDALINPADATQPEKVRSWTEPILGIQNRPTSPDDLLAAPPASVPDLSDMKVAVAGLVHHKSGLGQNAQNSLKALKLAGIHACSAPFFPAPGGWNPRLGPSKDAIKSLEDHTVLLHLPIDQVIPSLAAQPALLRTDRLIGYFMWELETVPRQFNRALDLVDEIWTATEFVADAFRNVTDTPVHVTGHAVDVSNVEEVTRAELGIAEDAFVVHFSFDANSTVARKNPNAALDAFDQAFSDDPGTVFVLKVRNFQQVVSLAGLGDPNALGLLKRIERRPRVVLLVGEYSYGRSIGLIAMSDCYISLHRSEGFGYSIAEAMMVGTPVIATSYSGNLDFMITSSGVDNVLFTMSPIRPGEYFFYESKSKWAEPAIAEAVEHLRRLRVRQTESKRLLSPVTRASFELSRLSQRMSNGLCFSSYDHSFDAEHGTNEGAWETHDGAS